MSDNKPFGIPVSVFIFLWEFDLKFRRYITRSDAYDRLVAAIKKAKKEGRNQS